MEFDVREKVLLEAYLPGVNLISEPDRTPDITIEHEQSESKKLIQDKNRVLISDTWKKEFPSDFYHLLYSIARLEFIKHNLFPVHAACVGKDDYILVVGHTGVGKTSVVLELLKNKNLLLFSGNKTVVSFKLNGDMEAIAGTKTITASHKDIERHLGDKTEIVQYGNRTALLLDNNTDKSGRIRAIVLVSLNDGVSENNLIESTSALHRLYAYFLDTVNADTVFGENVYVGTPLLWTQEKLAQNLKEALSKIPAYSIKGSIDFVCDSITKL